MARNNLITVRLTNQELDRLERIAQKREVPMSEVVRDLLKTLDMSEVS